MWIFWLWSWALVMQEVTTGGTWVKGTWDLFTIFCNLLWIHAYFKITSFFKKNLILVGSNFFHFLYFPAECLQNFLTLTHTQNTWHQDIMGKSCSPCPLAPTPRSPHETPGLNTQPAATPSVGGKAWRERKEVGQAEKERRKEGRKEKQRERREENKERRKREASICHSKR